MRNITLLLLVLAAGLTGAATAFGQNAVKSELLIPEGMPVTLHFSIDTDERGWTRYNIRREAGPEVIFVTMQVFTVGPDNRVDANTGQVGEMTIMSDDERARKSWPHDMEVRRLIVIVERVETSSGVWVLDTEGGHADLQAVVERGRDALPKAKFIPKD